MQYVAIGYSLVALAVAIIVFSVMCYETKDGLLEITMTSLFIGCVWPVLVYLVLTDSNESYGETMPESTPDSFKNYSEEDSIKDKAGLGKEGWKIYPIKHWPTPEVYPKKSEIKEVRMVGDEYIRLVFKDGRMLSIPMIWIPEIYYAAPEDRQKFEIYDQGVAWDPDKGPINWSLMTAEYLTMGSLWDPATGEYKNES